MKKMAHLMYQGPVITLAEQTINRLKLKLVDTLTLTNYILIQSKLISYSHM